MEDPNRHPIPRHIAIIMDGNGRWAKQRGLARIYGHQQGVEAVRKVVETCSQRGVEYLTLYAFSTENWNRPEAEVTALMELLVRTIRKETPELNRQDVRIRMIGDAHTLPEDCRTELQEAMDLTRDNKGLTLVLAISYSGRSELTQAMRSMAGKVERGELQSGDIDESTVAEHLYTHDMPDPELVVRTSGEYRISNYLLWQCAYAEFHFTDALWPDFDEAELDRALASFAGRERRFGKVSEQLEIK